MTETYKVIPDTEGTYSVSDLGNVRNNTTGYTLNPYMTDRGYLQVSINFTSLPNRISVNVHKLVARAFVENHSNLPVVNHIDGIKTNNISANLEWVTYARNNEHAVEMGLIKSGEDSYLSVLKENQVREIIIELEAGARNIDLAKKYNVAHNTIDDIRCNRTWRFIERQPILGQGPVKKLCGENIATIREMFTAGLSNRQISLQFGVAPATIDQIRKGNTWKNY